MFSGFSHFSISELFLSTGNNPHVSPLFHFAPCLCVPLIIHHLCFYLFLFSQLLFLYLWPPFPLLDSPVSIAMPFDQTSSPYSLLRAIVARPALEWSKKDRLERTERRPTEPARGVVSHVNNFPSSVPQPLPGLRMSVQPENKTNTKGRKQREVKVRP